MIPREPDLPVRLPFCWGLFVNSVWLDQVEYLILTTAFVLVSST